MNFKKAAVATTVAAGLALGLGACKHDSDVASENLSKDADNFKIARQIVVYNALKDKYVLEVDGFCALGNNEKADQVTYTCKQGNGYIKDIIYKSNNTFVFTHQLNPAQVSTKHVTVVFKPSTIVPDPEIR